MKSAIKFFLERIFGHRFVLQRVKGCGKKIALTFDDGPHITNTLKLLAVLDKAKVKATFFLSGSEVEKHLKLTTEIKTKGHEIGNHAFSHQKISHIGLKKYIEEIEKTKVLITECTGCNPYLFRPPFGELNASIIKLVLELKLLYVNWTVDSEDSFNKNKDKLIQVFKDKNIQGGDIILFHEDYETTIDAMSEIISYLKLRGFQLVTMSELKGYN